jgi:hypothetical protein
MTTNEVNPFDTGAWKDDESTTPDTNGEQTTTTDETKVDTQDKPTEDGEAKPDTTTVDDTKKDDGVNNEAVDKTTDESESGDTSTQAEPELTFKNELSKKVFDAILSGNYADVAPIIYEQSVLSNLDKLSPQDAVKLQMQYENPDMTSEDIEKEFKDRYEFEEEKVDTEFMTEEEVKAHQKRVEKERKSFEKELKRDARDAVRFLSEKREDIDIPNINEYINSKAPQAPDNSKEIEEYNSYMETERKKYEDSIEPSLEKITPFELEFKDDEVNFKVNFTPNKEDLEGMKDKLKAFTLEDYFGPEYYNQEKGEYNTAKLAEDIYWRENREKIVKSIVSQAVASAKADMLKKIKGVSIGDAPSSSSSSNTSSRSELDSFVDKLYSM